MLEKPSNPVFGPPEYGVALGQRATTQSLRQAQACGEVGDDCGGITTIAAYPPPDPPTTPDIAGLTDGTQTALTCLRREVGTNGGTLTVTSAYRSPAYQAHIQDVYDKYKGVDGRDGVENWPETRCPDVQRNVRDEWDKHKPFSERPADNSPHSSGTAFDASWGTLNEGVDIDTLAETCGLSRPQDHSKVASVL